MVCKDTSGEFSEYGHAASQTIRELIRPGDKYIICQDLTGLFAHIVNDPLVLVPLGPSPGKLYASADEAKSDLEKYQNLYGKCMVVKISSTIEEVIEKTLTSSSPPETKGP